MKTIKVDLGKRSYPIYIGESILSDKELFDQHITTSQTLIVTNEKVAPLYLGVIENNFDRSNYEIFVLPDGESYKTLDSLNQIITKLMENKFNRTCSLIALGGGVVGDLAGFAASCYQRGVKFIQILISGGSCCYQGRFLGAPALFKLQGGFWNQMKALKEIEVQGRISPNSDFAVRVWKTKISRFNYRHFGL